MVIVLALTWAEAAPSMMPKARGRSSPIVLRAVLLKLSAFRAAMTPVATKKKTAIKTTVISNINNKESPILQNASLVQLTRKKCYAAF
jgi:hypothetical protein